MPFPTTPVPAVSERAKRARGWSARLLIAGTLLALATWAFVARASRTMPDFEVYWRTAGRAAAAESLYRVDDGHYQFKYLPAFAVLTIPLSLPPLPAAEALWFWLSLLTLVVLLRNSIRIVPERRKPVWVLVGASIVVLGKFYGHEL